MTLFQKSLRIRRMGRSYVIQISCKSPDRSLAAKMANATVKAYREDNLQARAEAVRQSSHWLESRIDNLRQRMNVAAVKAQEFRARRDYRITGATEAGSPKPELKGKFQNTLEELDSTTATYRKIYESYLLAHTEAVQRQSYTVSNARVISKATIHKSHPKTLLLWGLAFVIGSAAGILIPIARQAVTRSSEAPSCRC